jgi:hypothetical protein
VEAEKQQFMPTNYRKFTGTHNLTKAYMYNFTECIIGPEREAILNNLRAAEWASGLVPSVHDLFLSGGLGYLIVHNLAKKVINGKITIAGNKNDGEKILKVFNNKHLKKVLMSSISRGAALMKLNFDEKMQPKWSYVQLGNFILNMNEYDEIKEAKIYIDLFTEDSNTQLKDRFYCIYERRWFKDGENQAKVRYGITRVMTAGIKQTDKVQDLEAKDIPEAILEKYKGIYDFNKTYTLPIEDSLGVYLINNTEQNTKYPLCPYGESQLINAMDELYAYDHALTAKENDKYLGRGRVLVPTIMNANPSLKQSPSMITIPGLPGIPGVAPVTAGTPGPVAPTPLDKTFYNLIPSIALDKQQPQSVQFDLRTEQWWKDLADTAGSIAVLCGMSPGDVDPRLVGGQYKTDDQVDSEKDLTTASVEAIRELADESLNAMINDIAKALKLKGEFNIVWPQAGLTNTKARTERCINLFNAGLMALVTALKELHPDWSDDEVEEEIERINQKEELVELDMDKNPDDDENSENDDENDATDDDNKPNKKKDPKNGADK